jgi:hypothetical protein
MNLLGRPQDILVGMEDTLWYRPTLDGAIVSIEAAPAPSVVITDPDGDSVTIAESPARDGTDKLKLSRTWTVGTTPSSYLKPYRAVWTFSVGGVSYSQPQHFFVLPNLFISQVVESDLTDLDSQVKTQAGQASGTLARWIREAWGDIWDLVWEMTHMHPCRYPADRFRQAHIEQACYRLYEWTITRQPSDAWLDAARRHQARAKQCIESIISNPKIIVLGADADVGHNRQRLHGFF